MVKNFAVLQIVTISLPADPQIIKRSKQPKSEIYCTSVSSNYF